MRSDFSGSRRRFLKFGAAGALTLGTQSALKLFPALAQSSPSSVSVSAFSRFNISDFEVTIIQDGATRFETSVFAANAKAGEVEALLEANNLPTTTANSTFNVTLVNTGDQLVLLDTGLGITSVPAGGRLLPTLELLGVAPADINAVILSHYHPDHVNGVSDGTTAAFPNATYYFPQPEWDFLQNVPGNLQPVRSAKSLLQPVSDSDQLQFYTADAEIVPGVQAVAAHGHTPGHMALLIASNGSQLLNIVDAAVQSVISLQRPDWYPAFDAIPETAIETRFALLGRAADEGLQVMGYHFPFPGVGYVVRDGEAFRFVASL